MDPLQVPRQLVEPHPPRRRAGDLLSPDLALREVAGPAPAVEDRGAVPRCIRAARVVGDEDHAPGAQDPGVLSSTRAPWRPSARAGSGEAGDLVDVGRVDDARPGEDRPTTADG